ncbi:MAG: zinc-ribbon domain-containing protein [Pyrinomonadaceae bacterium]
MAICPKCGAAVRDGKAFCFNCGAAMGAAPAKPEETAPEFRDTVLDPKQERAARTTPPPSTHVPLSVMETGATVANVRADNSKGALATAPARRTFLGRRWVVVLLALLLLVLGFIALALLTD